MDPVLAVLTLLINFLATISTSVRIERTNALFPKTGRMENYRPVDESYGDDDGSSSPSNNCIAKNDGGSGDPT